MVIDILIEDSKQYTQALEYISRLPHDEFYPPLMRYARVLLEHSPEESTRLFIDYYTGEFKPKEEAVTQPETPAVGNTGALANLSALLPLPYMNRSAVATPPASTNEQLTLADRDIVPAVDDSPSYKPPRPRTAF